MIRLAHMFFSSTFPTISGSFSQRIGQLSQELFVLLDSVDHSITFEVYAEVVKKKICRKC